MKVTMKDGTVLNAIAVHSDPKLIKGMSRDVLTFLFDMTSEEGLAELAHTFREENCTEIILGEDLQDENGNQIEEAYSWRNYTIFLSVGIGAIADVIIGSDDMSGCAWVRMAQKSADELRIEELEELVRQLEGGES